MVQILKGKLVLPPYLSPEAKDFIRKVSICMWVGTPLGILSINCTYHLVNCLIKVHFVNAGIIIDNLFNQKTQGDDLRS